MAVQQIPDGSWVSSDGRWLWRDVQWIPMPAARGTGVFWFTSTPGWVQTLLIMGLIGLIPFVGAMNVYGYAIVTARNVRAGYRVLPRELRLHRAGGPRLRAEPRLVGYHFRCHAGAGWRGGLRSVSDKRTASPGSLRWWWLRELRCWDSRTSPRYRCSSRPWKCQTERAGGSSKFTGSSAMQPSTGDRRGTGPAIFLLWYLIYFGLSLAFSVVPLGGLLAAVAALPVLAPMIASPCHALL